MNAFAWITCCTGFLLLVPLIAMLFTDEVNWDLLDFVVMGILLFGTGVSVAVVGRMLAGKRRVITAILIVVAFLLVWVELAVGVFTNLGD